MSTATIANLPRISRERLATLIRSKQPNVSIIDVRDSDFIGGHIVGCQNVPVHTHDYRIPELARTLQDSEVVVFHCALSQQRGPKSALAYLRERERLLGKEGKERAGKEGGKVKEQQVYVLEGGFVKWQEVYGDDKELTEGYVKDIWAEY